MQNRRQFLTTTSLAGQVALAYGQAQPASGDRAQWLQVLERVARPVLTHMARRELKAKMPVEGKTSDRPEYTHLEAIGRTLAGIAPWLEARHPAEASLRQEMAQLAREAIDAATDPRSPDYCNFERGSQPVVDAAFLAQGLIRAPRELWQALPAATQSNVVAALRKTRHILPVWNNWLLFAAMVEAALRQAGERVDQRPVVTAVNLHESWYKGDGIYGDGPEFHWDYYNSFVIQPMLLDVVGAFRADIPAWETLYPKVLARARRYAVIQERFISPEGTFPPVGRSLAYRIGVFQLLGQVALLRELPADLKPAQVRCALTAVMKRQMLAAGTFDDQGWLRIGFAGRQPGIGERYISTGSCYLCATGLLPLGLPPEDEFWSGAPMPWTSQRIWRGEDFPADHALTG
ncbi:MAG: DUF2264 domain-containing protein [Acidobacteria bacterium]|nr:DUF2264 domain-containing protein [Acidobacteriota bacterium]